MWLVIQINQCAINHRVKNLSWKVTLTINIKVAPRTGFDLNLRILPLEPSNQGTWFKYMSAPPEQNESDVIQKNYIKLKKIVQYRSTTLDPEATEMCHSKKRLSSMRPCHISSTAGDMAPRRIQSTGEYKAGTFHSDYRSGSALSTC